LDTAKTNAETAQANLLLARQAVDEMYSQVADDLAITGHMLPYQHELLQRATRFYEELGRRKSGDPVIRLESIHAALRVAAIQNTLGRPAALDQTCVAAMAELELLNDKLPADGRIRATLCDALATCGGLLLEMGRRREAEPVVRRAVAVAERLNAEG